MLRKGAAAYRQAGCVEWRRSPCVDSIRVCTQVAWTLALELVERGVHRVAVLHLEATLTVGKNARAPQ